MAYLAIYQIEDIYYPFLGAVGILVNLFAIVILSRGKCGLSKCITRYLVGMATADLLLMISDPILNWVAYIYLSFTFLNITPVCSFITFLMNASKVVSVWLTVAFTFDRFVAICCEKLKIKYCTERTAAIVIVTVNILGSLESVPWYFTREPGYFIGNTPWGCVFTLIFQKSAFWIAFDMFHLILTPCVPFFLILLLNFQTARRILAANRVRRGLRSCKNGENNDLEIENRRRSIILLFSISGSFILLWMTQVLFFIYIRIRKIHYYLDTDPLYITESTAGMLQLLNSCTNTCIYVLTQSKFRDELKNAVKYPLKCICNLVKH